MKKSLPANCLQFLAYIQLKSVAMHFEVDKFEIGKNINFYLVASRLVNERRRTGY